MLLLLVYFVFNRVIIDVLPDFVKFILKICCSLATSDVFNSVVRF